jgi:hypothetical protein
LAAFLGQLHKFVMPGLVPGIPVFGSTKKDVDGRDKPGHDDAEISAQKIAARTRDGFP